MRVGAVRQRQPVGPAGTDRNFDPLDRLHQDRAQVPVKDVDRHDIVDANTGCKFLAAGLPGQRGLFEGQPIGAEAIIADGAQSAFQMLDIGTDQAALQKQRGLIIDRGGRFIVLHTRP
jgi:hypothetical protein